MDWILIKVGNNDQKKQEEEIKKQEEEKKETPKLSGLKGKIAMRNTLKSMLKERNKDIIHEEGKNSSAPSFLVISPRREGYVS